MGTNPFSGKQKGSQSLVYWRFMTWTNPEQSENFFFPFFRRELFKSSASGGTSRIEEKDNQDAINPEVSESGM